MAYVNVTNWLLRRSAGALFNLQKTPYDKTVNGIDANPKKTQNSATVSYSREFLTNWPADTVFKISASSLAMNKLELETTSTFSEVKAETADLLPIWEISYSATGASPIFDSIKWTGGTNEAYDSVDIATNIYTPFINDDGDLEDAWQILSYTASWNSYGQAVESNFQELLLQSAPNTLGTGAVPCTQNGSGSGFFSEPNNSIWAKFSGITNAKDFADEYVFNSGTVSTAAFCMRIDADSAHTLTPYVRGTTNTNFGRFSSSGVGVFAGYTNNIFSYRHTTSDKAMGFLQKHDTTCKWYYTPDACEDCWYEGKVVKVRVAYKKAPITYTYNTAPTYSDYFENLWTIGTWASHSTVDYDLTIPAGYTRQQLGSTFTVPTVDGYIVTIDDIKFISVT